MFAGLDMKSRFLFNFCAVAIAPLICVFLLIRACAYKSNAHLKHTCINSTTVRARRARLQAQATVAAREADSVVRLVYYVTAVTGGHGVGGSVWLARQGGGVSRQQLWRGVFNAFSALCWNRNVFVVFQRPGHSRACVADDCSSAAGAWVVFPSDSRLHLRVQHSVSGRPYAQRVGLLDFRHHGAHGFVFL